MAEFGLEATNNSNVVTISNNARLLVFSERGTVNVRSSYSDRPGYGTVTLAKPIRTTATPEIFVRVASFNRASVSVYFTFIGSPGNWTGFKITAAAAGVNNLIDHVLEYVACKYSDSPSAEDYGVEMYNENGSGEVIFNSTDAPALFDRFTKRWAHQSTSNGVGRYTSGLPVAADDFIGVSGFDRGAVFFGLADFAGVELISASARVLNITINHNPIYQLQDPSMGQAFNFCMPVCKFPASVYG